MNKDDVKFAIFFVGMVLAIIGFAIYERHNKECLSRENEKQSLVWHEKHKKDVEDGIAYENEKSFELERLFERSVSDPRRIFTRNLNETNCIEEISSCYSKFESEYMRCKVSFEQAYSRLKSPYCLRRFENKELQKDKWMIEGLGRLRNAYKDIIEEIKRAKTGCRTESGIIERKIENAKLLREKYLAFMELEELKREKPE